MEINDRMFDFKDYYDWIASEMPDDCRLCEVGIANGASALYLAQKLKELGKRFTFYFVDNMDYGGKEQLKTVIANVVDSGMGNLITIIPEDSLTASCRFPDGFFDFVFIDASHLYELTKADIRLWYYKVKDTAYLAGHDFNHPEVNRAVKEVIPTYLLRWQDTASKLVESGLSVGIWFLKKIHQHKLN